jgi:hypothetical protein
MAERKVEIANGLADLNSNSIMGKYLTNSGDTTPREPLFNSRSFGTFKICKDFVHFNIRAFSGSMLSLKDSRLIDQAALIRYLVLVQVIFIQFDNYKDFF